MHLYIPSTLYSLLCEHVEYALDWLHTHTHTQRLYIHPRRYTTNQPLYMPYTHTTHTTKQPASSYIQLQKGMKIGTSQTHKNLVSDVDCRATRNNTEMNTLVGQPVWCSWRHNTLLLCFCAISALGIGKHAHCVERHTTLRASNLCAPHL